MNRFARVTSIDSVRTFRTALQRYQEELKDAVAMLDLEVERGVAWLSTDRMALWPAQIRDSSDELTEAKSALVRKKVTHGKDGSSFYDEKKAVQRAKERTRYCEQRFENTKKWLRIISHDAEEFQGLLSNLGHFVESDLTKAIAKLDNIIAALDKYASNNSVVEQPNEP